MLNPIIDRKFPQEIIDAIAALYTAGYGAAADALESTNTPEDFIVEAQNILTYITRVNTALLEKLTRATVAAACVNAEVEGTLSGVL